MDKSFWNISTDGWLTSAQRLLSPNCDARPDPADIALIVIHCISLPPGQFGGPWIDQLFSNTLTADDHPYFAEIHHLKVSAHILIRRDGAIKQYVPFQLRAWHAGTSSYQDREHCNDFSIGIELEGTESLSYTDAQYTALAALVAALLYRYPTLSSERIVGHSDIAPGRKTDPGPSFIWELFRQLLTANLRSCFQNEI